MRIPGNVTHTCAEMIVSKSTYDEIAAKMRAACYDHVFHEGLMDMHGIALSCEPDTTADSERPRPHAIDAARPPKS